MTVEDCGIKFSFKNAETKHVHNLSNKEAKCKGFFFLFKMTIVGRLITAMVAIFHFSIAHFHPSKFAVCFCVCSFGFFYL